MLEVLLEFAGQFFADHENDAVEAGPLSVDQTEIEEPLPRWTNRHGLLRSAEARAGTGGHDDKGETHVPGVSADARPP